MDIFWNCPICQLISFLLVKQEKKISLIHKLGGNATNFYKLGQFSSTHSFSFTSWAKFARLISK